MSLLRKEVFTCIPLGDSVSYKRTYTDTACLLCRAPRAYKESRETLELVWKRDVVNVSHWLTTVRVAGHVGIKRDIFLLQRDTDHFRSSIHTVHGTPTHEICYMRRFFWGIRQPYRLETHNDDGFHQPRRRHLDDRCAQNQDHKPPTIQAAWNGDTSKNIRAGSQKRRSIL